MYHSVDDLEQDMKLMVDNAVRYHGAKSVYARLGAELYDVVKE